MRLVLPAVVALALAPNAFAAPRVTIYPRHPDPRLTLLVSATGVPKEPVPLAGIACGGAAPRGDTEFNADSGAPLIWDFDARRRCTGDPLTGAVFSSDGREIARRSTTFDTTGGVRIVLFLTPRNGEYPLLRPAPGRFYPRAGIWLEAAGLPPLHHFSAELRLIGRARHGRCLVRNSVKQGRSNGNGVLTRGQISGYPPAGDRPFCRGRSYTVRMRDVADDALYGEVVVKIRRSARP